MNYVMRHGRRIEVETINMPGVEKKKRKRWVARWVKLPRYWITALRNTRSARTYELAHIILPKKPRLLGGEQSPPVNIAYGYDGAGHRRRRFFGSPR